VVKEIAGGRIGLLESIANELAVEKVPLTDLKQKYENMAKQEFSQVGANYKNDQGEYVRSIINALAKPPYRIDIDDPVVQVHIQDYFPLLLAGKVISVHIDGTISFESRRAFCYGKNFYGTTVKESPKQ